MPLKEKPEKVLSYIGVQPFILNNYIMFLLSLIFTRVLGLPSEVISLMMPINQRKQGVIIDSSITNLDMSKRFDDYQIEQIQVSTLILHAKDDKTANFQKMADVVHRFPNCTFMPFEAGGHMLVGFEKEYERAIKEFINLNRE